MGGSDPALKAPLVLIDATAIPANRGGVGRYVESIVGALASAQARTIIVCQTRDQALFESLGVQTIPAPSRVSRVSQRLLWEQFALPRLARRLDVDLVHSPHYTFPLWMRVPRVVTIHDLTFFTMPELHSAVKRVFFRWWIRAASRFGVSVIAVSQATASEYARLTNAEPTSITVSHLGYDERIFHAPAAEELRALQETVPALPPSWIAFLGTLEPRKNVVSLIEGYCDAVGRSTAEPPALLLAGDDGWDDQVDAAISRARQGGADVRKLGYLPLESLSAFLGGSTIFAYPSLGEGFGLPVLEAMASGACVLTTDRLSLPEVGGDAAVYTGVSSAAIADSLHALLEDEVHRAAIARAGVTRAMSFTWAAAASRHVDAYRRAAHK